MPFWINTVVVIISFTVTALSGFFLIPYLRKLKCGQTILDIGPNWHKSKQGTPTMGGFMFIIGTIVATLIGFILLRGVYHTDKLGGTEDYAGLKLLAGIGMALMYMLVGFLDDYIKVVKKRNLGLKAIQKVVFQVLIAGLYLFILTTLGDTSTAIYFPLIGNVDFGLFYYPLMIGFIIFIVNSVNLTDGIDGLCSSVTLIAALAFLMICVTLGNNEYAVFSIALAGACLGFLLWNLNPAKVFMGDTGSMFLGGAIVAIGFATGYHLLLVLIGIIYVVESVSVILQIISFKTTGKRIFKMSPIHHHFEMSGWGEYKIVIIFSLITLLAGVIAVAAIYFSSSTVLSVR